jgi:hypothetical protein
VTNLWRDVREIYGSAWAFALACPILFLIPVLFEFAQHVVEVRSGLYLSPDSARAAENDPSRMIFGFWKVLAISLPTYWLYRYIVSKRDAAYARAFEPRAVLMWLAIFLPTVMLMSWLSLFGPSLPGLFGLEGKAATVLKLVSALAQTGTGIYLTAWFVAWSQGNAAIGPRTSFRIMNGFFWHTVALILAGTFPLMALHYAALFAIGQPEALVWAAMVLDSFVVGFLSLTMIGANAVAAMRAAERKGVILMREAGQLPVVAATA